ncbi:MAG: alpha/beta hydrolase [Chloroflexi bacterium]|nr:alpha/beta hydrolase [Chloroflexota bacterium]
MTATCWSSAGRAIGNVTDGRRIARPDLDSQSSRSSSCWPTPGRRSVAYTRPAIDILIHCRRDLSSPVDTAWSLARAWPDAALVVLDDAGHQASASKRARILEALDRFARA